MTDQQNSTETTNGDQPEPEVRYRLSPLVLTIFKHETNNGRIIRHCDLQRIYTPDDGESFDYTHSLRPRDLRKAAELLTTAANRLDDFTIDHINDEPAAD